MENKKLTSSEVREMFPKVVAFADEVRKVFGPGVKLLYACENGREIGRKSDHKPEDVVKLADIVHNFKPVAVVDEPRKFGRGRK